MKIFFWPGAVKRYKGPVVALGVFDGVHAGHGRVLLGAVKKAKETGGKSVVVTFFPHPRKQESIYSLPHRLRILDSLGIDACVVIKFNRSFARLSAVDFISRILVKKIGASYIYVGENFRFGKGASGTAAFLKKCQGRFGFSVKVFKTVKSGGKLISSTHIRALIKQGSLFQASRLLTRPVSVFGTVVKGVSVAGGMGYPTANVDPHHEVLPPCGIYAVTVCIGDRTFKGACYIGSSPTFSLNSKRVEVHIFDFDKNIYGKEIEIRFIKKIRDEARFSSKALLAARIKKDIKAAKIILSRHF